MKVLILGKNGQLAQALIATAPEGVTVSVSDRHVLDLGVLERIQPHIIECQPDIVINATAYTAVDKAEDEPKLAHRINAEAVNNLVEACKKVNARLVHVSTDFVFDGSQNTPYRPTDRVAPLSVYGASKLAGEDAVRKLENFAIIRTAWVYSATGQNFVKTMLRLMNEREELGVVYDQVGGPTFADNLAMAVWKAALTPSLNGTFHYTDAGVASWYDFAYEIHRQGVVKGLIPNNPFVLKPILSGQFKTKAVRPHYSVLDCSDLIEPLNIRRPHWTAALADCLDLIKSRFSSGAQE
ncbi:dTDP-4-dehydrorhamnose reductase [Aestuariibacter halophilus]|uniref:dTDP-4-dehydrorhamnose reductase n=1 Tax=Fluctibacter halophilus TaxID=226011 RepID=A0ABS8G9K1_9ALTE|nr:dTDP-4-dehydrorhamnose reductase [Aestuariibacter halophilus]MCC2617230.1 dTDP-4-dehydrorhamnose reductase [Aestuariibacter halophilus]